MGYSGWKPDFRQDVINRMANGETPRQIATDLGVSSADVKNLYENFLKKNKVNQINQELIADPQYEGYTVININIEDKKWKNTFANYDERYIDYPELFDPRVIANFEISNNIQLMRNPHKEDPIYQRVFKNNAIYWDQGKKIYKISRTYNPKIIDNTTPPDYYIDVNKFGIVEHRIIFKKKETK